MKKNILIAMLILLSTTIFAADDSCSEYSGDAKDTCNSVAKAKSDFYNKYAMSVGDPTENKQDLSSCNGLSGIEKDTCLTKTDIVTEYSLTLPTTTTSSPAKSAPPKTKKYIEKSPAPTKVKSTPPSEQKQEKINIYKN